VRTPPEAGEQRRKHGLSPVMAHHRREGIAYRLPLPTNSLTPNCPNRVDLAASGRSVPALDGLSSVSSQHVNSVELICPGHQTSALGPGYSVADWQAHSVSHEPKVPLQAM